MITLLSLFSLSLASRFCSLTWFWMTSLTSLDVILLSVWADVLLSNLAAAISSLTRFSSTLLFNSFSKCATLSSTFFRKISHLSSQVFFVLYICHDFFFTRWAKPMDFCFGCHQFIFFVIKANTFYTKNSSQYSHSSNFWCSPLNFCLQVVHVQHFSSIIVLSSTVLLFVLGFSPH